MELTTNGVIFSQFDFREILLTFVYKTIKGEYKNPQALKRSILRAYKRQGITETQRDGLLMSLDLEGEPKGTRYTREDLLALLERLLQEHYIKELDYTLSLLLGASLEVFSPNVVNNTLTAKSIHIEAFNEDLGAIVKDLRTI